MVTINDRRCAVCGETKDRTRFGPVRLGRDGLSHMCRECRAAHERARRSALSYPERARELNVRNAWYAATRNGVLCTIYNGPRPMCNCCGSSARLTLDHINGDGKEERAMKGGGVSMWLSLRREFQRNPLARERYQILCMRCNSSKGRGPKCLINHSIGTTGTITTVTHNNTAGDVAGYISSRNLFFGNDYCQHMASMFKIQNTNPSKENSA